MISTVEKILFLKSIDLFSQIPGEDLSQIAQITDEVQFEEGDEVFREGEPGDSLYLVIEGKIRIHRGGNEVATLGARQVFGEMALLDSDARSATAGAISVVTCLRISSDDFNEILAEKGEIAIGIIRVLSRRLRMAIAEINEQQQIPEENAA